MAKIEKEAGLRNGLKWMARIASAIATYEPGREYRLEAGEYALKVTVWRVIDGERRSAEGSIEYSAIADFTDGRNQAAFALTAIADKLDKR